MIRPSSGKSAAGRLLLGASVLAVLAPAIAGCEAGNDAPTLEFHSASSGAHTVFNGIQITNAFVLGAPSGAQVPSGSSASLFVSLYNRNANPDTLLGATAPGTATSVTVSGGTVQIPATAPANLTGPKPEVVLEHLKTPLRGGSFIPVTFDFQHAGTVTLQVPVEPRSFYWATYSPPPAAPTPSSYNSATKSPGATPHATPTTTGHGTATPTATATP